MMAHGGVDKDLDFNQAMHDFRGMFPSLDVEVIEAVLRANGGSVDDTVDQLLMMNMNDDGGKQEKNGEDMLLGGAYVTTPVKEVTDEQDEHPPSYDESIGHKAASAHVSHPSNKEVSAASLIAEEARYLEQCAKKKEQGEKCGTKTYKQPSSSGQHQRSLPATSSATVSRASSSSSQYPHGAYLGVFRTTSYGTHKGLEQPTSSSGVVSARRRKRYEETRRQAEQVRGRLQENEWQREVSADPQLRQYLEDEHVALMLQNREFMKELRRNDDFLLALNADSVAMEHERKFRQSQKSAFPVKFDVTTLKNDGDRQRASTWNTSATNSTTSSSTTLPTSLPASSVSPGGFGTLFSRRKSSKNRPLDAAEVPDGPILDPVTRDDVEQDKTVGGIQCPLDKEDLSLGGHPYVPNGPSVAGGWFHFDNETSVIKSAAGSDARNNGTTCPDVAEGYGTDAIAFGVEDPFPYTKSVSGDGASSEQHFQQRLSNMGKASKQKFALLTKRFMKKQQGAKGVLGTSDSQHSGVNLLQNTNDDYERDPWTSADDFSQLSGYDQPNRRSSDKR